MMGYKLFGMTCFLCGLEFIEMFSLVTIGLCSSWFVLVAEIDTLPLCQFMPGSENTGG